ncbi:MAG: tRNA (adenosine(37)-N6)-threonylcarbamoyltransferase complex ATPase subunit type 1 TsaE [Micrococcales bacterium]
MHELGLRLAEQLREGDLVVLTGPLGAGKTTLSRGVGEALGCIGTVSSPTFVIARTHNRVGSEVPLVHVDAYRLGSPDELDDLDIDFAHSISLIEWGRGFTDGLSGSWLDVEIERDHSGETEIREVTIIGNGPRWADVSAADLAVQSGDA